MAQPAVLNQAHAFPRRILLAVTGLSPQVLTETLYGLAVLEKPAWIPTEIVAVTTAEGARRVRQSLIGPGGHVAALCREHGVRPAPRFPASAIRVLSVGGGEPLHDIRSGAENARAADQITSLVRELTADPDCALVVSLAGGRKTMGFLLGYALTLFARPQDRLTHVLVGEQYESSPEFWYPTAKPTRVRTRDGAMLDARAARVELADIPFVRLRQGVPEALFSGRATMLETVTALQRALEPARVHVELERRRLLCGGRQVELPPQLFAWYAWTLKRRLDDAGVLGFVHYTEADAGAFLDTYRRVVGEDAEAYEKARSSLAQGMTKEFFEQKNAKVNRHLRAKLGVEADPYLIVSSGKRPLTRSGVDIERTRIEWRR